MKLAGEMKKGDLHRVRGDKFRAQKLLYLLTDEWEGVELIILLVRGSYRKFYRNLKRSQSKMGPLIM